MVEETKCLVIDWTHQTSLREEIVPQHLPDRVDRSASAGGRLLTPWALYRRATLLI